MSAKENPLFSAFREDHAVLGRGLYDIATHLRGGDLAAARSAADRLDREAGPHIAFEEEAFYPVLRRLLGPGDTDPLYEEHDEGLEVIRALAALSDTDELGEAERQALIGKTDAMLTHVSECGELFGTMGRIPETNRPRSTACCSRCASGESGGARSTPAKTVPNDAGARTRRAALPSTPAPRRSAFRHRNHA